VEAHLVVGLTDRTMAIFVHGRSSRMYVAAASLVKEIGCGVCSDDCNKLRLVRNNCGHVGCQTTLQSKVEPRG
jgi:hypothetical protein